MSTKIILKCAVAFSFCFSFTELKLEHVSKAFHITATAMCSSGFETQNLK